MNNPNNIYNIVLPKGEAERPFFELNEEERREIGRIVFQEVTLLAAKFGVLPVTGSSIKEDLSTETDQ